MKRRVLIVTAIVLTLFAVLPVAAVYWVLYSESGLAFAVGQLDHLHGVVRIRAQGVHGTLAAGARFDRVEVEHERVLVQVSSLSFRLEPHALLLQTVQVEDPRVGTARVEVRSASHPTRGGPPLHFLPSFLRISARGARIDTAAVLLPNRYEIKASRLEGTMLLTSRDLTITQAFANGGFFTARGRFELGAADPITLGGDVDWTLEFADRPAWRGHARAHGDLEDLQVSAEQVFPIRAQVEGHALALTHGAHWQAQVRSSFIDFTALHPAAKIAAADIDLQVSGDLHGMQAQGSLRPTTLPTGRLEVSARGPYPTRLVRLDSVRIDAAGGVRVDAQATLDFTHGGPALDVRGETVNFRWPIVGESVVYARTGRFTLDGPQLPYRITASGPVVIPKLPAFDAQAHGLLYADHLELEQGGANWLGGRLEASGSLSWTGRNAWSFAARGEQLDPARIDGAWPGRLGFTAQVSGAGLNSGADIDLDLKRASGTLRGEHLEARGHVSRRGSNLRFDRVVASLADAHLTLDGTFGDPRDIRLDLDAPHLGRVVPGLEGGITVKGRISGPPATARLTGTLVGHDLAFAPLTAGNVSASADIDLSDQRGSHLDLEARAVKVADRDFGKVAARLEGRASDHRFTFDTTGGLIDIHARVDGSYDPKGWHGLIGELGLRNTDIIDVHLQAPAAMRLSPAAAALEPLCLIGTNERICLHGDWARKGVFDAQASGTGIPLRALGTNLPTKPEYLGMLAFDAQAHGHTLEDVTGHLSMDLAEGKLRYKLPSGREDEVHLGSGHAEIIAAPAQVTAKVHLTATQQSFLDVRLAGIRTAGQSPLQTPISGEIHTQAHELGFLALLVDQIDRSVGEMNADFTVAGTLGEPRLDGAIRLQKGELDFYQVNLLMRGINARIDIAGTQLSVQGGAQIGEGKVQVAGDLAWRDRHPSGSIKLTGEKLMLVNIPELRADASPDLTFKVEGRRIDVNGTVTIPYARIKPADLTGAQLASGDEIILGEQSMGEDMRLQVYTDVKLVLGQDVTVDSFGLTGRLTGSVTASSDPSGHARGSGELKVEEGKYAAYGRQLDIQRGRLIFSGGLVSDPAVDLKAVKVFPDVTAGVNVRGKLRNPQISFFSDPSLPQSQIVSVLVAGGTIESLQRSGTQQVGQARNELLAQGGAIVAQQLGARLGVEDVGLESDTMNQTSLVLGKFLNPRLYVSYGISLTESLNTVKLRYTLGDHWTIKTEAGENRSTDLVYTIER